MSETSPKCHYKPLEVKLGHTFKSPDLLVRALTHPSYCHDQKEQVEHNQRLEFLGDAVLGFILAEELFHHLPHEREGELTRSRSALAKGKQLSALAGELGLSQWIRLSEAEERNDGRNRPSILEDTLEAVIGAIYLDSDLATTTTVVKKWIGDIDKRLNQLLEVHNPKGTLQELIQPEHGNNAIDYRLLKSEGPDHARVFTVEVLISGEVKGHGVGSSKKEAEEHAALIALQGLVPA
jgi:ribonuclease-3